MEHSLVRFSILSLSLFPVLPVLAQTGAVTGTPDLAVAAEQRFTLNCSAQGAARYVWTVQEPAGVQATFETGELGPFSGREVLDALGGGVKHDLLLRCSAYDGAGALLGTHETALTAYDGVANRAADGLPALVVPKAQLRALGAQVWEPNGLSGWVNTLGTVDPLPLGVDEGFRLPNFTVAIESGPVIWNNPEWQDWLKSPNGNAALSLCTAAVSKARETPWFLCPGVESGGKRRGVPSADLEGSNESYEGNYQMGMLVSRSVPLPRVGMSELEQQYVGSQLVRTWDASLGESFVPRVAASEGGLFTASVVAQFTHAPDADVFQGFLDLHSPQRVAVAPIGQPAVIPLAKVMKGGLIQYGNPAEFRILALYQVQGTQRVQADASTADASGTLTVRAPTPGRAIFFLALQADNGAVGQTAIEVVFE